MSLAPLADSRVNGTADFGPCWGPSTITANSAFGKTVKAVAAARL